VLARAQAPDQAAPAAARDDSLLEEVVVTARRREETLQDAPVAISAFTTAEIRSARIESLADLSKLAPGLNYTPLFGAQNQLPIIRGAAQTFGALNVGVFLDGVYLSGKAGVDLELNDLERVEIVRGPQSALYGRNTFAGAINYITKRPSSTYEGEGEITVGERGLFKLMASASGPINDSLRFRVGAFSREFDGFYTSSIDGGAVDFSSTEGAQLTLEAGTSVSPPRAA
jgi:iron complex outermembrane receptor protein